MTNRCAGERGGGSRVEGGSERAPKIMVQFYLNFGLFQKLSAQFDPSKWHGHHNGVRERRDHLNNNNNKNSIYFA